MSQHHRRVPMLLLPKPALIDTGSGGGGSSNNSSNNAVVSNDFDYVAFMHVEGVVQDISFLAGDGVSAAGAVGEDDNEEPQQSFRGRNSSGSSENNSNNSKNSIGGSSHQQRRQRLERRAHTKSRRGCYNCKKRRIKCQETRPACRHCVKTGLTCEYPATPQIVHQPQHQIPLFSLQDMRFFQHFLLTGYPTHPVGNESVWQHEVPCLAQNYEYLMHAILGLAASELMAQDPSLLTFAMTRRLKAIKAIKKTLAEIPKTEPSTIIGNGSSNTSNTTDNFSDKGNALMATCFALTFQSVCLDDGMAEFMTFCRGIVLVATQMYCRGAGDRFIFHHFFGADQMAILKPRMERLPPIRAELTDMAAASLRRMEPLLRAAEVDREYHGFLVRIVEALYTDSFLAYKILCEHYGWWMQMPHCQFQQLVDVPGNQTMVVLAAHWIALKQIMAPITDVEKEEKRRERMNRSNRRGGGGGGGGGDDNARKDIANEIEKENDEAGNSGQRHEKQDAEEVGEQLGMVRWLRHLNRMASSGRHRVYVEWPMWVEAQLDADLGCFGKTT